MQQEGVLDLMCPNHGEKIISVQLTENGENQMFCLKCFTQKQIPIEQLAQQLTDLRSKKIKNLIDQERISEKRLGKLKKLFITIKEQFNTLVDNIIKNINDGIHQLKQIIKEEIELLKQPIQQLNITQFNKNIEELKKQQQLNHDLFIKNDEQLRNKIIKEYQEFIQQLNQQIKQGSDWNKINTQDNKINTQENKINTVIQNTKIENNKIQVNQKQLNEYKLLNQEKRIYNCLAMAMDKDQKILINGQSNNIQIWDFNQDGTLKLKQTLNGHTDTIRSLCFSQREYWFISGSDDKSMRIWKKQKDGQWDCQQILEEAHKNWVTGIVNNNDEDQFISCSPDKTIKVWMKELDGIQWKCVQTMTEHSNQVRFLSLNPESNLLASSGIDRLRIWQKDKDQIWKQKKVIDDPKHLRIKFIDNNELIASTCKQGRIIRYNQNNNGIFQLQSEFKLNEIEEQDIYCFPIIYNKLQGLSILRHSNDFTYILKRNDNDEFIIHQVLNGNYKAGYLIKDGQHLILANYKDNKLEILKPF